VQIKSGRLGREEFVLIHLGEIERVQMNRLAQFLHVVISCLLSDSS
jgi:hypothetical protein